jgi:formamidopyrimidine-DNA glycosylase
MPELPDVTVYLRRLAARVVGRTLERVRLASPFVLRTALPPVGETAGRRIVGVERVGKRVVLALEGELFVVVHLMVAGRFRWAAFGAAKAPNAIAFLDVRGDAEGGGSATLVLTEAGTRKRASIHVVQGREALRALDAGGIDVLEADREAFAARLAAESRTVKRALTDPRLFSGIGNAYADEILHAARLSPVALTRKLTAEQVERLHAAVQGTLRDWIERLDAEAGAAGGWPAKVTAFHPAMKVHGRFGQPCPDYGAPVQRIVHAENETNYCARCQTGGRLLADRALSLLLKDTRPKHVDEL